MTASLSEIVAFWNEAGAERWFAKDDLFDATLRERFEASHRMAAAADLTEWQGPAEEGLALLLLLDQVPRNIYRGTAHAFATDPLARTLARGMVDLGLDREVPAALRVFVYLPFEHSEDARDQLRSLRLFGALFEEVGDQRIWDYAREHARLIEIFGRFPHRNRLLGRFTTPEEQRFLDEGGFAG
ncbi:Uncharacterized conserved protein, DUF924 family [Faunimonas pinastri]|uniref:Uncharacterized conserved protein, DUF924 family n=1 Tax=Faunimonas pinastri TaxID=1855383 RepID=A0A1H9HPR8_9HYPH|nr:DUF924 family protein [Faunimonas pinastri]SEQ64334.1 Uncharacterized conserved protein, DUF924 family [Faunimonas pinastri]